MMNKSWGFYSLVLSGLAMGWMAMLFFSPPNTSKAQSGGLFDYILYGVDGATRSLMRYDFASGETKTIGVIRNSDGQTLNGIEGVTHIPGNLNLITFWPDPADDFKTKMVYINALTARASVVGQELGHNAIIGATTIKNTADRHDVYAIRSAKPISFEIVNGKVIPNEEFSAKVTVLGAAIDTGSPQSAEESCCPGATGVGLVDRILCIVGTDGENGEDQIQVSDDGSKWKVKAVFEKGKSEQEKWFKKSDVDEVHVITYGGKDQIQLQGLTIPTKVEAGAGEDQIEGGYGADTIDGGTGKDQIQGNDGDDTLYGGDGDDDIKGGDGNDTLAGNDGNDSLDAGKGTNEVFQGDPPTGYHVPVTTKINVGTDVYEPFGGFDEPVKGNVNDNQSSTGNANPGSNPRHYVMQKTWSAGTAITTGGKSWSKKKSSDSGTSNSHWEVYSTFSTSTSTPQIKVLRDGDAVPDIASLRDQAAAAAYVKDYIDYDTNTMDLGVNQIIYLYEFDASSSSASFQDLALLVTLAKTVEELGDDNVAPGRLISVNHVTGEYESVMVLERSYDSLAAIRDNAFYATADNKLYLIDPDAETETEIGSTPSDQNNSLEFAGAMLMNFSRTTASLMELNKASASMVQGPFALGVNDLRGIVMMLRKNEPRQLVMYD